jgi:hypothetical protein
VNRLLLVLWCVSLGVAAARASADTIVLKNGTIVRGTILEEKPDAVMLQRTNESGTIKFTEEYKREDIAKISKEPAADEVASSRPTDEDEAEEEEIRRKVTPIEDKPKYLREAIADIRKERYRQAGIALARLIHGSSDVELRSLSRISEREADMPLDELAAETHLQYALQHARGGPIRLRYVTPYETRALTRRLESLYDEAVDEVVTLDEKAERRRSEERRKNEVRRGGGTGRDEARGRGESAREARRRRLGGTGPRGSGVLNQAKDVLGRPEGGGFARPRDEDEPGAGSGATSVPLRISEWISRPEEFNATRPEECRAFANHIRYAQSLLEEYIRYNPEAKEGNKLDPKLADERKVLGELLKSVTARSRGALTPQEKEAREAERRQRIEQELKRRHELYLRKRARTTVEAN